MADMSFDDQRHSGDGLRGGDCAVQKPLNNQRVSRVRHLVHGINH